MIISSKSILAAVALVAVIAGPACAIAPKADIGNKIRFSLGSGSNIRATVNGDTVTLRGYYRDAGDKVNAIRAARQIDGINHVINLAFQST